MSKAVYTEALTNPLEYYYATGLNLGLHSSTSARYDSFYNDYIELGGKFSYEFNGEAIKGGTVESVEFYDKYGAVLVTVTGLSLKAVKLDDLLQEGSMIDVLTYVYSGKDRIVGSDNGDGLLSFAGSDKIFGGLGDDIMNGGAGNDRLTGGAGSDTFVFINKFGKDVITDFDAVGGGTEQDYISADVDDVAKIVRSGDDLIVKFDGGYQITLLDVARKDFSPDDFSV